MSYPQPQYPSRFQPPPQQPQHQQAPAHQPYPQPPQHHPAPAARTFRKASTPIAFGAGALAVSALSFLAALGMLSAGDPDATVWANFSGAMLLAGITNLGVGAFRVAKRVDYLYRNVGGP